MAGKICHLESVLSEKRNRNLKKTFCGSTCLWMTGLFGTEPGFYFLWLQVPKEPTVQE